VKTLVALAADRRRTRGKDCLIDRRTRRAIAMHVDANERVRGAARTQHLEQRRGVKTA